MIKRLGVILVAAVMLLGSALSAQAVLKAVDPGPYLAAYGFFPAWYEDENSLRLELCLSKTLSLQVLAPDAYMCGLLPGAGFDPTLPIVFPSNFPDEAFWFSAEVADQIGFSNNGSGDFLYIAALEAAFGGGPVAVNDQVSFARIRIRVDLPSGGTYTVTHPYGVETFTVAAGGRRAINFTSDFGLGAPGVFTGALGGQIGPFLERAPEDGGRITIGDETYLGDPNTVQRVTGSPTGSNFVRLQGPGIQPTGPQFACPNIPTDCVQFDRFTLLGKLLRPTTPTAVTVDRATYSRTAAGAQIDVFATSTPTASLSFRESLTAQTSFPMTGDGQGKFFGQDAGPASIPASVIITATDSSTDPAEVGAVLVDVVKITAAVYDPETQTLMIEASSSDQLAQLPTLTALGFGRLEVVGSGPIQRVTAFPVVQPPARVTVRSSEGGSDTEPVRVVPAALPATPVASLSATALTFASQTVGTTSASQTVTLSNTGTADLVVSGVAVTGTNAGDFSATSTCTTVTPGSSCSIGVTFTPAAEGARSATLSITDNAAGSPRSVALSGTGVAAVAPVASLSATALTFASQTVGTTSASQTVTLSNTGQANLVVSSVAVTGTNAGDFTQTNNCTTVAPGGSCTIGVSFTPTAEGARSATLSITDNAAGSPRSVVLSGTGVAAVAEVLTVASTTVSLRGNRNRQTASWDIAGTTTVIAGNQITVRLTRTGQAIGTATPDRQGRWRVRLNGSNLIPVAGDTVTATSTFTTTVVFPVTIR